MKLESVNVIFKNTEGETIVDMNMELLNHSMIELVVPPKVQLQLKVPDRPEVDCLVLEVRPDRMFGKRMIFKPDTIQYLDRGKAMQVHIYPMVEANSELTTFFLTDITGMDGRASQLAKMVNEFAADHGIEFDEACRILKTRLAVE